MSQLTLYSQFNMRKPYLVSSDICDVAGHLAEDGVRFERRPVRYATALADLDNEQVEAAFAEEIIAVKQDLGCLRADCVTLKPSDFSSISIRDQFLSEHTHSEDEVRWFLSGSALFYIHVNARIHIVQCGSGDFIVIPKGTKHWFDMGPEPNYRCLRWYNSEAGLETLFTGSYVAESTPRWETVMGASAAAV